MKRFRFYFYDYEGSTQHIADFNEYCKSREFSLDVVSVTSVYDGTVTTLVADENIVAILYCNFPHNVTWGEQV